MSGIPETLADIAFRKGDKKMAEGSYYVYALKDPRNAKPFYIGKGTGTRAYDHLANPDNTRKGIRIQEILDSGNNILVSILVDNLSELQAIKIEAELISAFGVEENGGILTNSVIPTGEVVTRRKNLIVPNGIYEKAQIGLSLLKDAVLELAKANPDGITNADTANYLGLRSDYGGGSRDYLS